MRAIARIPQWSSRDAGWCRIPSGCFVMGSPPSEPGRGVYNEERTAVTLTRAFEIGEHEITQEQWTSLGLANPSGKNDDGSGDCSSLSVRWVT